MVAKRLDSVYEPGARSGAWRKLRLNRSEEFVIGGYTRGGRTFDSVVLGRYEGERLVYVARTRVGFTPASRERLMAKLRPLETAKCPFANLPEARSGRWGEGLTVDKMKECVWVRPELVAEVEFVEWTPDGKLRRGLWHAETLLQIARFVSFVCNENDPRVIDHMLVIAARFCDCENCCLCGKKIRRQHFIEALNRRRKLSSVNNFMPCAICCGEKVDVDTHPKLVGAAP